MMREPIVSSAQGFGSRTDHRILFAVEL